MSKNLILSGTENLTMTSLEIAELVGSRHDSVKRTIETLAKGGVIVQPQAVDEQFTDAMGRPRTVQVYRFTGEQGKLDSIVAVAQLSPEFTARLVDRWQELESAGSPANLTPSELLLMHAQRLVDMEREQAQLKAQVTALVEGEDFMTVVGYCNLTGRRIDQKETARIGKLAAAPTVQGEPVGWHTEDHLDDKSATTYSAEVAQRWRDKGWSVWPLYTAPQPAPDVTQLVDALESLIKGYVGLLEAGKDRITSLGGDCDPVPVMEKNDPWLRGARAALTAYRNQGANP